ncbi:aminopeptidase P N-terminal domain-containing protein [Bdellovibrio sp. HCB-162]|uniref:aminopeptidase P N-terminal domain-containing protein n=1 Tax=Bdellovibrio sp. HCB-162 TaxID=3394234 RepID=UPI0039BD74DA
METMIYQKRRQELGLKYSRTLFVISSGDEAMRSHSVAYRHKTAGDFYYLTGVHLIGAVLLVIGKKTYFLSDANEATAVWDDGHSLTAADKEKLQDVNFESVDKLADIIHSHTNDFDRVALAIGRNQKIDQTLLSTISYESRHRGRVSNLPLALCDSRTLIGTMRLVKDNHEISLMKEAGRRSSLVHRELMKQNLIGKSEREVVGWIESQFMAQGMPWTAYESIAGAGERSTILHARGTDRILNEGEIVLIDAGGEYQGYCADITRVLPVGKKFSAEQKKIYQIVLDAQKAVLENVKSGVTLKNLHEIALTHLSEGMLKNGFAKDTVQENLGKFMPHSTSHWIGLDVHDPSSYVDDSGNALKLAEGMCFTVEPGLYFREGIGVPSQYLGIGVRIEDDVAVTATGAELLTSVPKEISEIEGLRAGL